MSQIIKKFIQDNAIDGTKIRLLNNQTLRSRNAGNTADIDILKVDASDVLNVLRELSLGNNKITNLADPVGALDAVNKQYMENFVKGVKDPKDAAKVATTSALPACTYSNGTSSGVNP